MRQWRNAWWGACVASALQPAGLAVCIAIALWRAHVLVWRTANVAKQALLRGSTATRRIRLAVRARRCVSLRTHRCATCLIMCWLWPRSPLRALPRWQL